VRYPNRPVVGVTWFEASAYCRWRGERFRLPDETEWDRAARGQEGRLFPWGDTPPNPQLLNFAKQSLGRVAPVGLFPLGASPEGVMDLAGNAFEWCSNDFDPAGNNDPVAPKVVRGGCYRSVALFVRSAFRGRYPADTRADFLGFRICQSVGRPPRTQIS
jgi:formylglycine-generating enzyme required for sulfatase activity